MKDEHKNALDALFERRASDAQAAERQRQHEAQLDKEFVQTYVRVLNVFNPIIRDLGSYLTSRAVDNHIDGHQLHPQQPGELPSEGFMRLTLGRPKMPATRLGAFELNANASTRKISIRTALRNGHFQDVQGLVGERAITEDAVNRAFREFLPKALDQA